MCILKKTGKNFSPAFLLRSFGFGEADTEAAEVEAAAPEASSVDSVFWRRGRSEIHFDNKMLNIIILDIWKYPYFIWKFMDTIWNTVFKDKVLHGNLYFTHIQYCHFMDCITLTRYFSKRYYYIFIFFGKKKDY